MKITATERIDRINQKKATAANIAAVVEVFRQTENNKPADTVAAIVKRLGYSVAVEAVAELVNTVGDWDARIFPSVREWANGQTTAATHDELNTMGVYQPSEIHPVHINQLAEAMSKYQPEDETSEKELDTMKENENFPLIKNEVLQDASKRADDIRFFIQNGFMPTWAAEHRKESDEGLKRYSTEKRWAQYKAGLISREKAVEFASKRALKALDKDTADKLQTLDRVAAAPDLQFISISVEWVKNSYWGLNPHAEARTNTGVYEGRASGCGYDKESAALAEAFNRCDSILKELFTLKENSLNAGISDECKNTCTGRSNTPVCGYGAGYGAIPYFEGGVGSACFWEIFKKCGFGVGIHNTRRAAFYEVVKVG